MMAFFFTMPISSTMPISAITLKSLRVMNKRQQRAHARRGQRGKNGDGMDVAFVQHAQHDVDRHQRGQNQHRLVGQRCLKRLRRALKRGLNAGRHADFVLDLVHRLDGLAERCVGSQIERKRHHRKLALVIDRDGRGVCLDGAERRERNLAAVRKCRGGSDGLRSWSADSIRWSSG